MLIFYFYVIFVIRYFMYCNANLDHASTCLTLVSPDS